MDEQNVATQVGAGKAPLTEQGVPTSVKRLFPKPFSLTPDAYVTLRDGPVDHAQDRLVHKNLLCENSSFFKAAIGGQWREKDNECIELPDDEVEVVDWYLAWLYGKNPFAHPSPLHRLLSDVFLHLGGVSWFDDFEGSAAVYEEIAKRFVVNGNQCAWDDAPWRKDPCVYHSHKQDGSVCYKEKFAWGKDIILKPEYPNAEDADSDEDANTDEG